MSFYPKQKNKGTERWVKLIVLLGAIGSKDEASAFQRRTLRLGNYAILIYIIALIGFGGFYGVANLKALMPVVLLAFGFVPLLFGCLWLNHKKHTLLARVLSNLLFTLALFLPLALFLGRRVGIHYFFLMLAVLPVLSLHPNQLRLIIPLSGLNIASYYWVEYMPPAIQNLSYFLPLESVRHMKDMSLILSILTVMIIIWINQRILLSNEQALVGKTTKLKVALDHLRELATIDQLTGLFNRTYFDIRVLNEMARARRYATPLSLIIFDLDYFKGINDTFGHDIGDKVLRHASHICNENIRESDILARWGGEEFVILAPQTDLEGACQLAEKLRSRLESSPMEPFGVVTGSFGVTVYKQDEDFESWYRRVDQALYRAKSGGRNRVETG